MGKRKGDICALVDQGSDKIQENYRKAQSDQVFFFTVHIIHLCKNSPYFFKLSLDLYKIQTKMYDNQTEKEIISMMISTKLIYICTLNDALRFYGFNKTKLAKDIKVSRDTLYKYLESGDDYFLQVIIKSCGGTDFKFINKGVK